MNLSVVGSFAEKIRVQGKDFLQNTGCDGLLIE